ncbi:LD-carboxypeptidase [Paenibacillus sp. HN-1]|uniref:S66 family peptidase n=1 Tax=Paenibacillus TaxID=44249 RepID=UPI001CA7EE88|nr:MULTISPECIES: S66 peptidase family protein [Paenibacillus]MBY9079253.1 LD-carboxypeptidase [Paenibacillus sp. CGMCC 1.18879]MBY9086976.1 LD-carboxypeptidase [Paenibacillus sinensis]
MIRYPHMKEGITIGVTAPSYGVKEENHDLLKQADNRLIQQGYQIQYGETVWTQDKAKSSPARLRASELNKMMTDEHVDMIFPPWGGELLIEILEFLDFNRFKEKWILGYSDISLLLLAVTLRTGIATAHGTNLIDLRGEFSDPTTARWKDVLSTRMGESVLQHSSEKYQREWKRDEPSPCIFDLTEPASWKIVSEDKANIQGRLLGGCIDVIRHLIGTPYGNVGEFQKNYIHGEPIVWFLENCELNTADLRRSLVHMKLAGWFDHCSGILFGRSSANQSVDDYTAEDVYAELAQELNLPVIYDIDCGHVPPQMTLINGARAVIEASEGQGTVLQVFSP